MVLEYAGAPYPERENDRQDRVVDLCLTSHDQDPVFDKLVELAAACLKVPIALVSILDNQRQWFLARTGLAPQETPRNQSFCAYAILQQFPLQVPDALADPRFRDNPLVTGAPNIRFYAGIPLVTEDGLALGSLCVIDTEPRPELSESELSILRHLAGLVMTRINTLRDTSYTDPVTKLFNSARLTRDLLVLQQRTNYGSVLLIDVFSLSYVKDVVKALGYSFFNDLLVETARVLHALLPAGVYLYKVSPTRFAILLEDADTEYCQSLAECLLQALQTPIPCNGIPVQSQAAVGLLAVRPGVVDHANWLRLSIGAADYARSLRHRWAWFRPELDEAHQRSFAVLGGISAALMAGDQLSLVYQPKLDMKSGRCVGVEALLRWKHPTLGQIGPAEFIPLAEKTALVSALTLWVMHEALRQLGEWRAKGLNLVVSINISAGDLETPLFAEQLLEHMGEYRVEPQEFELEFTESVLISNPVAVKEQLLRLRGQGVQVAIDDFGSGYSNWSYLRELPATALKIDKSFVDGLQQNAVDRRMVQTIIELAHNLDYRVVAEGVETQQDYDLLESWGCDEVQGYLIAKPLPPTELVAWLEQQRG